MKVEDEQKRKVEPATSENSTESDSIKEENKGHRQKRPTASMPTPVQRLFNTCNEVFANAGPGIVPPPDDVARIRSVLDSLKPKDVGLKPNQPFFRNDSTSGPPAITYLHLCSCPNFSIGVFCLPQSAVIPLHNHPGMTVFSKILLGSMHIKSYDWVSDPQNSDEKIKSSTGGACLAKVGTDAVFKAPCETSVLYPTTGGNLHCFTATTSCAVLDVLGPPYDDDEERACTYYREYAYSTFPGAADAVVGERKEEHAWLEAREGKPRELVVRGAKYKGPRITQV